MTALLVLLFIAGYALITLEHQVKINKAAIALVTGVLCWTIYILFTPDKDFVNAALAHHLGELSGIIFFLMGAMVIVELIDAHDGFDIITARISTTSKVALLWIIAFIAFFLSAMLDNLTTTIVIGSLLRKLVDSEKERIYFMGVVVIAANAGGAWSPIGDVTTTMLWIGGQVTSWNIIRSLFIPSFFCVIAPLVFLSFRMKGVVARPAVKIQKNEKMLSPRQRSAVFFTGAAVLVMVPVFKTLTHLPPYLGILLGLGILWIVTELLHGDKDEEDKHNLSVVYALRKIDTPSVLFFFGILVSIASLQSSGILSSMAAWMTRTIANDHIIVLSLGLLSAVVDNVPLVAAVQGMYPLEVYPTDHDFWNFLAYCTGTGGSILIIGSAAGVAAMGIEKLTFFGYLKTMSFLAFMGYLAGAAYFILTT